MGSLFSTQESNTSSNSYSNQYSSKQSTYQQENISQSNYYSPTSNYKTPTSIKTTQINENIRPTTTTQTTQNYSNVTSKTNSSASSNYTTASNAQNYLNITPTTVNTTKYPSLNDSYPKTTKTTTTGLPASLVQTKKQQPISIQIKFPNNLTENEFLDLIDEYIRSCPEFDSTNPLNSHIPFSSLQSIYSSEEDSPLDSSIVLYIQNSNYFNYNKTNNTIRVKFVTPKRDYKKDGNPRKWLGSFECPCGKYWKSAHSWTGYWQKCKECQAKVYPYYQERLVAGDGVIDPNKPHDSARCERCRELGSLCTIRGNYST